MSQLGLFTSPAPVVARWTPRRGDLVWYRDGARWASILVLGVDGEQVRGVATVGTNTYRLCDLHRRPPGLEARRG